MIAKKKPKKKAPKKSEKKSTRSASVRALLDRIEYEGLHYAFIHYGMDDYLKQIDDKVLKKLASDFIKASNALEEHLEALNAEFPAEDNSSDDEDYGMDQRLV